jgi:hypothetical protein
MNLTLVTVKKDQKNWRCREHLTGALFTADAALALIFYESLVSIALFQFGQAFYI